MPKSGTNNIIDVFLLTVYIVTEQTKRNTILKEKTSLYSCLWLSVCVVFKHYSKDNLPNLSVHAQTVWEHLRFRNWCLCISSSVQAKRWGHSMAIVQVNISLLVVSFTFSKENKWDFGVGTNNYCISKCICFVYIRQMRSLSCENYSYPHSPLTSFSINHTHIAQLFSSPALIPHNQYAFPQFPRNLIRNNVCRLSSLWQILTLFIKRSWSVPHRQHLTNNVILCHAMHISQS